MLGSILKTAFGWLGLNKWLVGAVGAAGLAALLSIGWLNLQLSWKDATIAKQETKITEQTTTINNQKSKIDALELTSRLDKKANDVLNDRVQSSQDELHKLIEQIDSINSKGAEDNGPVAPVLDEVVRSPSGN